MSVKHAMLALLSAEPATTYQLRKRFDASTAQSWPLNIGQVSTTLQRLERDGLVERAGEAGEVDGEGAADGTGRPWHVTGEGREALAAWWASPVPVQQRGRDELVVKLAVAVVSPGIDVEEIVQTQRMETQRAMHDITRLRREVDESDLVARLILDRHLFLGEAELRWLDDIEGATQRAEARARRAGSGADEPHANEQDVREIPAAGRAAR